MTTKRSSKHDATLESRRSVIVTFKRKDQRADTETDKLEIVQKAISSEVRFFDAGSEKLLQALPHELVGFDINLFEAPIVSLSLTDAEITALRKNPDVTAVENDGMMYALPLEKFEFEGQPSPLAETIPIGVQMIKAPAAWGASRGKGIKVAVLDTGIDWTHPDLHANVRGAVSFVPGESPMDGHSHGTHCAGTIAACINGAGVVGVAPEAYLYAVKVLTNTGSGSWSYLIAGLAWCIQNGIHIASMSLGGGGAPVALETMCNAAFQRGVLLVAAAGNNGAAIEHPGKYKNVIAVSAIDSSNMIAGFSSRGPEVELCAPGVQVLSTAPGGGYSLKSGTSMACPHVAGAAAVVWGAHRFSDNQTIWNLLASAADNLGVPGWDPLYGYGRVDVEQSAMALVVPPVMLRRP